MTSTITATRTWFDANPTAPPSSSPGFRRMFVPGRMTLGVFFPIESYAGDEPSMLDQAALARLAESGGFAALWLRDVPLRDRSFGDTGQVYDPWVWLGYIAAQTQSIALATGAIVLPLRHVLHVAKAAASVDRLSGGRLVLGVATGDRPVEFPLFGRSFESRGEEFRSQVETLRRIWREDLSTEDGLLARNRVDIVPKPFAGGVPLLVTGRSQQTLEWIAANADGWVTYPRPLPTQKDVAALWRSTTAVVAPDAFKPLAQSLYIDLDESPTALPVPIHLGYRLGRYGLCDLLRRLADFGVHHVVLNLKYGSRPAREVLDELATYITPLFPAA